MQRPVNDRGSASFGDGATLWLVEADTLRTHGLSADDITRDPTGLLELVHRDDEGFTVADIGSVHEASGPFTVHYRLAGPDGGRTREFLLVGQVGRKDEATDDVSGYVVDLTAHMASATSVAVNASSESRAVIEQAKGAFMMAYGISEDEAFSVLVALSSRSNVKLREVTATIVSLMNQSEFRELHCSKTLLNISEQVLSRAAPSGSAAMPTR